MQYRIKEATSQRLFFASRLPHRYVIRTLTGVVLIVVRIRISHPTGLDPHDAADGVACAGSYAFADQ
jgi:hypothetical protein